jgi:uncharacterized repeat protein (TIGR03803 family)
VLYRFAGSPDGSSPSAGLINVNGTLYGTTYSGGAYNDNGTVFSVSRSGKEKVLYSFRPGTDGARPLAGLLDVNGTLYGTTYEGGAYGTEPSSASLRPGRRKCCIASPTFPTAVVPWQGSSTRRVGSTERRLVAARTWVEPSTGSPRGAKNRCCIASAMETTDLHPSPACSTSRGRSTERRAPAARTAARPEEGHSFH